jgi:hypothetical protein
MRPTLIARSGVSRAIKCARRCTCVLMVFALAGCALQSIKPDQIESAPASELVPVDGSTRSLTVDDVKDVLAGKTCLRDYAVPCDKFSGQGKVCHTTTKITLAKDGSSLVVTSLALTAPNGNVFFEDQRKHLISVPPDLKGLTFTTRTNWKFLLDFEPDGHLVGTTSRGSESYPAEFKCR